MPAAPERRGNHVLSHRFNGEQLTAEDCILHKLTWNKITPSDRQLGDAAGIFAVQAPKLGITYMEKWGKALDIATELNQLLSGELKPKRT